MQSVLLTGSVDPSKEALVGRKVEGDTLWISQFRMLVTEVAPLRPCYVLVFNSCMTFSVLSNHLEAMY